MIYSPRRDILRLIPEAAPLLRFTKKHRSCLPYGLSLTDGSFRPQSYWNHYVPKFLQKGWVVDGRLPNVYVAVNGCMQKCENPSTTNIGAAPGLYSQFWSSSNGVELFVNTSYETGIFDEIDRHSAAALQSMLKFSGSAPTIELDDPQRGNWARLIVRLMYATPSKIESFMERVLDGFECSPHNIHIARTVALRNIVDMLSGQIAERIFNMNWSVKPVRSANGFVLGDAPVVSLNQLTHPDAQVVLPVSKNVLFVASNKRPAPIYETEDAQLVEYVNRHIVEGSSLFLISSRPGLFGTY